ncbi:MAG: HD domain-containing protein [Bacteroidetes bacterium]|nr:HD domain-containing protein [Bacteroidota bacterium]MDA0888061.1 HD domain-containing protein [Bacteroidota bacterium]MDA1084014.1 HD domain-containing protein [Bacteroidota bacterium]
MKLTQYNDPIYGFITIPTPFIAKLVNHPYVQRLRRIKQMGLSFLVFPSTEHTRFQHALGAMHLATKAVFALRQQGVEISDEEAEALYACMLLHDLGHGPFSHALEHVLFPKNSHEDMSFALMEKLNIAFDGSLDLAIRMFTNTYPRQFFHQLISSHIDLDRLDYLKRDSFYSGVTEGNINSERLISMMHVHDNQLVFNTKAVYSIEKFLLARRMMYMSVYLHKTSFVAEELLVHFFERAIKCIQSGKKVHMSEALGYFLQHLDVDVKTKINSFIQLDDADVWMLIKNAVSNKDVVLSSIAKMLLNRKFPKIKLGYEPFSNAEIDLRRSEISANHGLSSEEVSYFVFSGSLEIQGYQQKENPIQLCSQNGVCSLFDTSPDTAHLHTLTKKDTKYFLAFPKGDGYFS